MDIWNVYRTKEGFIEAVRVGCTPASDGGVLLLIIHIPKGKANLLLKILDSICDTSK